MTELIEKIEKAGLAGRVVTDGQLVRLLDGDGTPQSRYGRVNRAIHCGELLHLRRGQYALSEVCSKQVLHPFYIAQSLRPGSYISLQSALSYHDWIPESVPATLSIVPGRRGEKRDVAHFGGFHFYPLATLKGGFLEGVEHKVLDGAAVLVATPLRALLDIFSLHKMEYSGMDKLVHGLRIEKENLLTIDLSQLRRIRSVYKHLRMQRMIDLMVDELR